MKFIPITKGYTALVDDEDFDRISRFKWCASPRKHKNFTIVYTKRHVRKVSGRGSQYQHQYLHQFILGTNGIDHIDGDGLNNQRSNLRPASSSQNSAKRRVASSEATSKWRGVYWPGGRGKKWAVQINCNGTTISRVARDEADAAQIYNLLALELFGDFAVYNQPL